MKIIIFASLLILSNLFLFRDGFWFYQDAGFWPKTNQEALKMFFLQTQAFVSDYYYLGYDAGLFSFTRILVSSIISVLFFLVGHSYSQLIFVLVGYVLTFWTFYLFSGIFFINKNTRFVLSLLYTFNPLSYSLQGHVFYQAIAPFFIFTFHKFFYSDKKIRLLNLLLMLLGMYLWVSYIRFIQSNLVVIIPYLVYLFILNNKKISITKITIALLGFFTLFLPVIFSFLSQLIDRSQTAFNYGTLFSGFTVKYPTYNAFNIIQSIAPTIYDAWWWPLLGISFFIIIVHQIIKMHLADRNGLFFLNIFLVLAGISFYGLANFFGKDIYLFLIKFFPFIINEPYWGFYVLSLPLIVLVGVLMQNNLKYLYMYSGLFILLSIIPLLNLNDFQLQKYKLSNIPEPYFEYFVKPYYGVPESTYYYLGSCWRAKYMNDANVPTLCPNYAYRYSLVTFDDPRLVDGDDYKMSQSMEGSLNVDNFRITHNLKNIFISNDITLKKGPGPETSNLEIQKINTAKSIFDKHELLTKKYNENFTHYSYVNKNLYDFFIYSPSKIINSEIQDFYEKKVDINNIPIAISNTKIQNNVSELQNAKIAYKVADHNPTKYYVKISDFDQSRPLMLQLNQSFSKNWKIKKISNSEYDSVSCISPWNTFPITNNSRCQYVDYSFNLRDFFLISKPNLVGEHFNGNYLGNTWLISTSDLNSQEDEVFFVIIYEKQIYYNLTISVAFIALIILLMLVVFQEVSNKRLKRYEKP